LRRSCFVHAAALHLDLPFEGVGPAPTIATALCSASVDAWDALVHLCVERRAAFVILAGGLFADASGVRAQTRLRRGLLRLAEQGIQAFVALDKDEGDCRAWFAAQEWPSAVTLFPADRPLAVRVVHDGAHLATVLGQSHAADWSLQTFLSELPPRESAPLVAVAPCSAAELGWEPATRASATPAIDYWALGGSHGTSRQGFHPWIVEPGPLQARDGRDRHLGPRGAMIADLRDDKVVAVELAELDQLRWLRLEHAVSRRRALADELVDELRKLRAAHSGRGLLVDIAVTGTAPSLTLAGRRRLLAELRAAVQGWEPFVWCNSLRATPAPERGAGGRRDELAVAVVQSGRAILGNPLQRSVFIAHHCEPLLRRWTQEMEVDEAEGLIDDATQLAVAALLGEDQP
jgi:hypothetical protein